MNYLESLPELLKAWNPPKNSIPKAIRGKIKETLNKIISNDVNYLYFIRSNIDLNLPSGFSDFTRFINIPTEILHRLKDYRIASMGSPFKEHFSTKLGFFLSRVGLPFSPSGQKL
jgi:hypothetical protein